jgi:hypothetical protein
MNNSILNALPGQVKSAFLSNQRFANVVCRLFNAAKVETNTSFNQSLLTLMDLICIHMLLVNIGDRSNVQTH